MSLEYATRGLIGMLTPQANTTVEPEFNLLWPRGVAMINARLMSDKPSMTDRLVDYFDNYGASLKQFANAPVGAVGAACTGASYLAGREREAEVVEELSAKGAPFITAALAVVDALNALGAKRIGLVSPYPDDLNRASIGYWQSQGFQVGEVANAFGAASGSFHPIYSLGGSAAGAAVRTLEDKTLDAIVMLGTGMPTLHPIAQTIGWRGAPVMSCNLCLAWRLVEALDCRAPERASLEPWLKGDGWVTQLKMRAP